MKKGGIIGLSILGVVVGLLSTLFMPFSSVSKKANTGYENVLGDANIAGDAKVTDIALLGAHDAFSSGINFKSVPNPNEDGLFNKKIVNAIGKGLGVRVSKAQNASAKDMLNAGVRYFDARITKIENEYYTLHGYVSDKLETYLTDVVNFLDEHPSEYIIFDVQHFYTSEGKNYDLSNSAYSDLFSFIDTVKSENGNSLLDFVKYDSTSDSLSSLTYNTMTTNKTKAGALLLVKNNSSTKAYYRDDDGSYDITTYNSIRSVWHKENNSKAMISGIEEEYNYLKEHDYSNVLVVNQAQKTAVLPGTKIITGILQWSLLDMANLFNKELTKDKDRFIKWLEVMPIVMVDYATSNTGNFNKLANEYIKEFNHSL